MSIDAVDRLQPHRGHRSVRQGRVKVAELAVELDVSEMTIRRDLDLLAEEGWSSGSGVARWPSGPSRSPNGSAATPGPRTASPSSWSTWSATAAPIGIDASTTLQRLAGHLGDVRELTVVTNGPDTFPALQDAPGGHRPADRRPARRPDRQPGRAAGHAGRRTRCCCAGCSCRPPASTPTHGTSEATLEEAEVKLALADVAAEVVLAVDSSKLGQRARPGPCPRTGSTSW